MRTDPQKNNDAKDKFLVRFENENQRVFLKMRAAKNRRTMNAEVLFLIDKGLEAVDGVSLLTQGGDV